jgi:hypothetical protein
VPHADSVLNFLMQEADIFKVGRRRYLVAPLNAELVDLLIVAAGATEDAEEDNPDLGADDVGEPSLGQSGDDLEADGVEDGDHYLGRGEPALGWANDGSQAHLSYGFGGDESEPELGWSNTGSQKMRARDDLAFAESDGNCDDEPDDDDMGIDDFPMDEPNQDREPSLCGVDGRGMQHADARDMEGDGYALTRRDVDYVATARARWRGKRSPTELHPDGQLYHVSYDVSGARILTPITVAEMLKGHEAVVKGGAL